MPNWTWNNTNIQGEPKDVREFMQVITELSANPDDAPDVMYNLNNCNPTPDACNASLIAKEATAI